MSLGVGPDPRAALVVVSGPSGVGKTTLVESLIRQGSLPLRRAVTATTRSPRPGEIDGVSYHFWTRDRFLRAVEEGQMLEWEQVFGKDYYGTPRGEVDPYLARGQGVVLVIDVKGAARIRDRCPGCLTVFVAPPNLDVLERRLRGRRDVDEAQIQLRLQTARHELARAAEFNHVVVNDDLPVALQELESRIRDHFQKRGRCDA